MTEVLVDLRNPTQNGEDIPAAGYLECRPTLRRTVDAHIVLPDAFTAKLIDGQATLDLAPTLDGTWAWSITERTNRGARRLVAVPDVESVAYSDLLDVDPATLDPSAPVVPAYLALIDAAASKADAAQSTADDASSAAGQALAEVGGKADQAAVNAIDGVLNGRLSGASVAANIQTVVNAARPHPLTGWFAALAQRDTTPADIVICGDSIAEGQNASITTKRFTSRVVTALRSRLGVTGGGFGFIPARYGAADRQTEYGWATTGRITENLFGFGKRSRQLLLDGGTGQGDGTMTRTIPACTSFTLMAHQHSASNTSLFVSIDGGADQVWDIPSGPGVISRSSGALTAGSHTVRVKARSTTGAYFEGVMVYNGDETSGIRLWDAARSGTRADQYTGEGDANNALWLDSFAHLTADLVILEWITNDAIARTAAQYETSMRTLVALIRAKAPNVPILLLGMYERNATLVEPWQNYVDALKRIQADTPWVALLDLRTSIPKPGGADTYGLLADGVHPNDKGHALIADLVAGYLLPQ